MLKRVGVDNKAIASLICGMLTKESLSAQGEPNRIQIFDQLMDGKDFTHLQAIGASTLPALSATIGWRTVLSYIVPPGKVFVPSWLSLNSTGTLQALARVSRRLHLWSFAGAAVANPTVPGNPTISANRSFGMGIGTRSYKWSILNNVGETLPTAATASATTTASTDGISTPLVAVPAGGTYRRMYATKFGQGATGPWYLVHEIDHAVGGYTDTHPDGDLQDGTSGKPDIQPPAANTTQGSVSGVDNPADQPVSEIVYNVLRTALSGSPTAFVYIDEDGLQEGNTTTVTLTADTQTVVPLKQQGVGLTGILDQLSRTKAANFRGGDVNHGLKEIKTVNGNPATGQYNIYGYVPLIPCPDVVFSAAVAGANHRKSASLQPVICYPGWNVTVDLVHPQGATPASATYIVDLVGRLIDIGA